jgi:diguanylate cyclase
MFDIDHFKQVNDTHGHLAGDSVLRILASLLRKRLRPTDDLGRYGGEEFCAVLPGTSLESALAIGEELRGLVETHQFSCDNKRLQLTMSVGVASWNSGMDIKDFYKAADDMLYLAKRSGRNRVCPASV